MTLEQEFERAVRLARIEARKHGYNPSREEQMVQKKGAVAYAKELIRSWEPQSGLKRLKKMNRLDLSIEHLIANEDKFAELFSCDERKAAKWRLEQVGR